MNALVVPGKSLGAVRLGMPLQALLRRFIPDTYPDLTGSGMVRVKFSSYHGLKVLVDKKTQSIVEATAREFFHLRSGLGPGRLLQEFYSEYPRLKVMLGKVYTRPDGSKVRYGKAVEDGLVLKVERIYTPGSPFPIDKVVEIGVYSSGRKERL